jgi:hypothetical protein
LEATVSLIEDHRERLAGAYDLNVMMYALHAKLAYMFMHSGHIDAAIQHLGQARKNRNLNRAEHGKPSIPSHQFVEFLITNVESADANTRAHWRIEQKLDTNMVVKLKQYFSKSELDAPP